MSEVCHLRYEDIRRSQKMIHVPLSKNRQGRYTILSGRNLEILTEYWYRYNDLFKSPLPSLHPKDLLIGAGCGIALYFIVYFKAKNAKKFWHGMEYGLQAGEHISHLSL